MASLITAQVKKEETEDTGKQQRLRDGLQHPPPNTLPGGPAEAANLSHALAHRPKNGFRIALNAAFQAAATHRIGVDTGSEAHLLFQHCLISTLQVGGCSRLRGMNGSSGAATALMTYSSRSFYPVL